MATDADPWATHRSPDMRRCGRGRRRGPARRARRHARRGRCPVPRRRWRSLLATSLRPGSACLPRQESGAPCRPSWRCARRPITWDAGFALVIDAGRPRAEPASGIYATAGLGPRRAVSAAGVSALWLPWFAARRARRRRRCRHRLLGLGAGGDGALPARSGCWPRGCCGIAHRARRLGSEVTVFGPAEAAAARIAEALVAQPRSASVRSATAAIRRLRMPAMPASRLVRAARRLRGVCAAVARHHRWTRGAAAVPPHHLVPDIGGVPEVRSGLSASAAAPASTSPTRAAMARPGGETCARSAGSRCRRCVVALPAILAAWRWPSASSARARPSSCSPAWAGRAAVPILKLRSMYRDAGAGGSKELLAHDPAARQRVGRLHEAVA